MTSVLYEIVKTTGGNIGSSRACAAFGISRNWYDAWLYHAPEPPDALLQEIREITVRRRYGYRRVTAVLRRKGIVVNHKRVLALTRENGLLCRRKRYRVVTTDSNHGLPVYPNFAKGMALTGVNQLWVADITYVQLPRGFAYLAVVLDAFSRKCLGWQLSLSIDAKLCLDALDAAFAERKGTCLAGLVHHSDRGVQYVSDGYTDALRGRGVLVSMSRRGNPYDNAKAESFMKTFKVEEVYLSEYESFADAKQNIDKFIGMVYNEERLHSSLGYLPPAEYEAKQLKEVHA